MLHEVRLFVLLNVGKDWQVLRHVASCNGVPIYSETDRVFQTVDAASLWADVQEREVKS